MPQPHSLGSVSIGLPETPAQKKMKAGWVGRHEKFEKGAVLPHTQVKACPRVRVADLPEGFLKQRHIEAMERNQQIAGCCRHPENHEVEALKSHPDEQAPDIYVFHCTCGRQHRFLCVGASDDNRPFWDAG